MTSRLHIVASILLATAAVACDPAEGEALPDPEAAERKPLPKLDGEDAGSTVVSRPGEIQRNFIGNLYAKDEVTITPKATGTIITLEVEEGQRVEKGDLLFALDKRQSGLAVSQAKAQRKAAEVQLKQAERNLKRIRGLAQRGSTSPAQLEQAEVAYESAKVAVEQAKVGISIAGSNLSDRTMRSPIDGVVTELDAELGEIVNMTPPTTVMVIKNLHELELRARVPEAALAVVSPGTEIIARFPAIDLERKVEVTRLGDQVDPNTRTIELIAMVDNADGKLRPGMYVEVRAADDDADAAQTDNADADGKAAGAETAAQGPDAAGEEDEK